MTHDIIGFVRVIKPRYAEAGQREAMAAHNITRVLQEGGKQGTATWDDVLKIARPGTTVAVLHALLISDPRHKRKKGGTRKAFWTAFDALEAKGAQLLELYTGLRTDNREGRDRMTREAIDALARGRHKTSQSDKRGRPPKKFSEAQWEKAQAAWESRKLKTWADVAPKLPKGMTPRDCWNKFGARSTDNSEER